MINLHIGCGKKKLKGFINIDIDPNNKPDVICDIYDIDKLYKKDSVDEIYMCHILEHIKRYDVDKIISKLYSILRPGGILRISVPDFESCVEHYIKNKNIPSILGLICGGQKDNYDNHHVIFDFNYLKTKLDFIGFHDVRRYEPFQFLPDDFDDYSKAFLPHMDRNGQLMSLNVMCNK